MSKLTGGFSASSMDAATPWGSGMKFYHLFVSGAFPVSKRIRAESLEKAFAYAKEHEISCLADFSLGPIWTGEMRVDQTFKVDSKKYRMTITYEREK